MILRCGLPFLFCFAVFAVGCETKSSAPMGDNDETTEKENSPNDLATTGSAESQIREVIDETIRLLEAGKYREWAERYAPAKERTPQRLARLESQIREEPEKVQQVLDAFGEAKDQQPQFNPEQTEARFPVQATNDRRGLIVIAKENDGWFIKQLPSGGPRRQRSFTPLDKNLYQIGLALHNYHEAHAHLPTNILSQDGKPLLSWRVELLPHLGQAALYEQFRKNEPWDSPHNKALLKNLAVFGEGTETRYLAPLVEQSLLGGTKPVAFRDVVDGLSYTAMVVEVGPKAAIPWSKPEDGKIDADQPLKNLQLGGDQNFLVLMGDGRIFKLPTNAKPAAYRALFGRADRQPLTIGPGTLEISEPPNE